MVDIQNSNDVELIISRGDQSAGAGAGRLIVDEFSITTEESNDPLSGVGNSGTQGHTRGNVTHTCSFTIMGEDADLMEIMLDENGRALEYDFLARGQNFVVKAEGCKNTSTEFSGSDGEATEYSVTASVTSANYQRNQQA